MPEAGSSPRSEISPRHVAIIMNGYGRWATSQDQPRWFGHRAGVENLQRITRVCLRMGVRYLTVYAFSTENWRRPGAEVAYILSLPEKFFVEALPELRDSGVQIRHLGSLDRLSPELRSKVEEAVSQTSGNRKLTLSIAFNYGGQDEIVRAVRGVLKDGMPAETVTADLFSAHLDTAGLPDPDLIIRTSGEYRSSNFLIWQGAFSHRYYSSHYWPDFDERELKNAFRVYQDRLANGEKVSE